MIRGLLPVPIPGLRAAPLSGPSSPDEIDFDDFRFWHKALGWKRADASDRYLSSTHQLQRFWRSYVLAGFVVLAGESLAVLGYLFATIDGQDRLALIVIAATAIGTAVVGCFLSDWVASHVWRARFALAWSIVTGVAMAVCAYLDGGLESPMLFLIVVPVMYAALGLSPAAVMLCGSATVAELIVVGVTTSGGGALGATLLMLAAVVTGVATLAVASATERARLESHERTFIGLLRQRAEIDGLTGCVNYRFFHERMREEIDRSLRYKRPLSVMVCDVDLFKSFNDTYGHPAGDVALAGVGAGLRAVARATDLVGRVGGDEFAIIMPETTAAQAAELSWRIIADRAAAPSPRVTLSIGVAQLDLIDPSAVRLFRDADAALYSAKETGRHTVVAGPSTRSDAGPAERKRMSTAVRGALRESVEMHTILDTLVEDAPIGFAFIDRDRRLVRANAALAAMYGDVAENQVGRPVAEIYPDLWPILEPMYRRVLDEGMPVLGTEMLGRAAAEPSQTRSYVANHYPVRLGEEVIGIGVTVLDITDRKRLERAGSDLTDAVVDALSATAEARDPYTAGHQRRVSEIAVAIATELGYDHNAVRGIGLAATIHDIGKVAIPAEILSRPGPLSEPEMALVRTHSALGYKILHEIPFPWPVADMVLQHHERLDGSGYPNHLSGDQIGIGARIIAVADVVEAMASHRPYRPSLGIDRALATIEQARGQLFDPDAVDSCLRLFRCGPLAAGLVEPLPDEQARL